MTLSRTSQHPLLTGNLRAILATAHVQFPYDRDASRMADREMSNP